jgi:hypothetical protein
LILSGVFPIINVGKLSKGEFYARIRGYSKQGH